MFNKFENLFVNIPGPAKNILNNNLRLLKEYYPDIFKILESIPSECHTSIVFSDNDDISVSHKGSDILFLSHVRNTSLNKIEQANIKEPIYMLLGLGAGDELQKIFTLTHLPFPELPNYKLPIYVIEPDPVMLMLAMSLHDMEEIFSSGRVLLFIGKESANEFGKYLADNRQAFLPTHTVNHWLPNNHPVVGSAIEALNHALNTMSSVTYQLKSRINKYYKNKTKEEWLDILISSIRPLRIMGVTSRFTSFLQYSIRDLLDGFARLGHETLVHIEKSEICRSTKNDILATIDEFHPDIIIYIDHFRDEYPYLPNSIPFINWIQDLLPNIVNPDTRTFKPLDFTYVFARQWIETLKNIPIYAEHPIDLLTLGINPGIYHPIAGIEKTIDLLYVSHLAPIDSTLRPVIDTAHDICLNNDEIELLNSGVIKYDQLLCVYKLLAEIFDSQLIDELWRNISCNIVRRNLIKNVLTTANIQENDTILQHLHVSRRIQNDIYYAIKTRPLKKLLKEGIDVRIYGKHWDQDKELAEFSYGPIENGKPLNILMNQARINLNNSPGTSLHMRSMEILASGSFMLSRDIEADSSNIREYFDEHDNIAFFKNEIDIAPIVKHWLAQERLDIICSPTCKKAKALFDYKVMAQKIITDISLRCKNYSNEE